MQTATTATVTGFTQNDQFAPTPQTLQLFDAWCGIKDSQVLTEKAVAFREKALKVYPYYCIKAWQFIVPRVAGHPSYNDLLAARNPANKVLDIGCCMGTDLRMMIVDGLTSVENGVGIDLEGGFLDLGFELFGDEDKMKHAFKVGNILGDSEQIFPNESFDIIQCGSVFHLFDEGQTRKLSENAYKLLKKTEGSSNKKTKAFFGRTLGTRSAEAPSSSSSDAPRRVFQIKLDPHELRQVGYMHTPESLTKLLKEAGFEDVTVLTMADIEQSGDDVITEPSRIPKALLTFIAYK